MARRRLRRYSPSRKVFPKSSTRSSTTKKKVTPKEYKTKVILPDPYRAECKPKGGCRNCGRDLPPKRTAYCTDDCSREFQRNHFWPEARRTKRFEAQIRKDRRIIGWQCAKCGLPTLKPEVNHIMPVNGDRRNFSCHHHQDNLEVVCKTCHLSITKRQFQEGLIGKKSRRKSA